MESGNIPPKYFENISKQIIQLELHDKTNLTEKWKIAEYFGENLDILTDLIWIFNITPIDFRIYFQNI